MAFLYECDGRTWALWTDGQGVVHDEPVQPLPQEPLEPTGDAE